MNQLNLPEFRVIKAETNNFDYRLTVEVAKEPNFCIHCMYDSELPGNKPFTKHGIKDREVWDIDIAPCSSNPIARLRRKLRRITTFVKKLFSRKP